MTTATSNSELNAARRPVRLVARRDLQVSRVPFGDGMYWHVKDPLSLRYYQLRDEEYLILRLLDGRRSLEAIKQELEKRCAPRRIELAHLHAFLGMLHRAGLTVALADGQGEPLLARRDKYRRRQWFSAMANPLAIRFRGIDPTRILDGLYPAVRWLFGPWLLLAGAVLVLGAMILLLAHADVLRARVPQLRTFLGGHNIVWLAIALLTVKVVHELAHGLTCRHFGGRCHELGIMLLVFVPCLYCNVSDAWTLTSKWQRIAITGAGIIAELLLASICTFAWWFSAPGVFNSICLNIVVVCSVGTVLLNGNPLLRYDGYYILSDYLEIPNLQQEALGRIQHFLGRVFLNIDLDGERFMPRRRPVLLAAYGLAAILYRGMVIAVILWVCLAFCRSHGVAIIGYALIVVVIAGLAGTLIARGSAFLADPRRRQQVDHRRLLIAGLALVAFVGSGLAVPLPYHLSAPLILQPAGAQRVYVTAAGSLEQILVAANMPVAAGQPLARLRNMELEQGILELTGRRDLQRQRIWSLKQRQAGDPRATDSLPASIELLDSLEQQLKDREAYRRRLTLRAPIAGTVLAPRQRPEHAWDDELPSWSGTLLDPENIGCHVDVGTLFCLVGDATRLEAILVVNQADLEFIEIGQVVDLRLAEEPGRVLTGHVRQIAASEIRELPPELAEFGELPVVTASNGTATTSQPSFELRVELEPGEEPFRIGAVGWARIRVGSQSLGRRLLRRLHQMLGFASPRSEAR